MDDVSSAPVRREEAHHRDRNPRGVAAWVREGGRLLPDTVRLCVRMSRDRSVPRRSRAVLVLAVAYNVQPVINVIPDFVPVVGFLDNVVVTFLAVRYAIRSAGVSGVRGHWPGSDEAYRRLCRLLLIRYR